MKEETFEVIYQILNKVAQDKEPESPIRKTIFKIARTMGKGSMEIDLCVDAIAISLGYDSVRFGFWEETQTPEALQQVVSKLVKQMAEKMAVMKHPDNLPEILDGKNSGLVFVPTSLLRELWKMGESQKNGCLNESQTKLVAEMSADWVAHCQKAWGPQPGSQLTEIREIPF